MIRILGTLLLVAAITLPLSGDDGYFEQSAVLLKVATVVDSYVLDHPESQLQGPELILAATAHDPRLLEGTENLYVSARHEDGYSSVIACTSDQSELLLEDAGCTVGFDLHAWQTDELEYCEFELDLPSICQD